MIIASVSQFHICLPWVKACLEWCLNSVLNVKALVGAFNQEKALVGAFSVITNLRMELFQALVCIDQGAEITGGNGASPATKFLPLCPAVP